MNTDHTAETVILQPAPSAAELLAMLETAYQQAFFFTNWETRVRNALHNALGDTHPAHLSPDELTRFKDCVYRLVKNTGSIREPDVWIADHRARLEAAAKQDRSPIDQAPTCDGLLFPTLFEMNRYIVTSVRDRPQWLKNNLGYWRRIEDVLQEIASRQPPGQSKVDLGAEPAGTNDQKSPGIQLHNDDKDDAAVVHTPAGDCPPSDGPTSAPPLAPASGADGTTKSEAVPVDPTISEATPPAAEIASRAQLDAKAAPSAPAKLGSPVEVGDIATQRKSAERDPVALKNSPATTPALPRRVAYGATKAEVLSRAKAGIEAGETRRLTAERLACANEDFNASQKEIGQATGLSRGTVSRLLTWRRSGYKLSSPHGPTTRAGRASQRKHRNGSGGGAK
jgi:hypothetical protein